MLCALDSVGTLEHCIVDKVLVFSESVSIAEVVEGGVPIRRTKLFLVLGDLAIQLTGD